MLIREIIDCVVYHFSAKNNPYLLQLAEHPELEILFIGYDSAKKELKIQINGAMLNLSESGYLSNSWSTVEFIDLIYGFQFRNTITIVPCSQKKSSSCLPDSSPANRQPLSLCILRLC